MAAALCSKGHVVGEHTDTRGLTRLPRHRGQKQGCTIPQWCLKRARVCPAISRGVCGQVAELQEQILDLEGRLLQEEIKVGSQAR